MALCIDKPVCRCALAAPCGGPADIALRHALMCAVLQHSGGSKLRTTRLTDCLRSGLYLPLTAVLGGVLFVRPEGYAEAQRDVIRLTADVELLREQQGFITCEPLDPTEGGPIEPLPLHCSLLVIPAQV